MQPPPPIVAFMYIILYDITFVPSVHPRWREASPAPICRPLETPHRGVPVCLICAMGAPGAEDPALLIHMGMLREWAAHYVAYRRYLIVFRNTVSTKS